LFDNKILIASIIKKSNQISKINFKILFFISLMISVSLCQTGGLPYPFQNFVSLKKPRLVHYPENPIFLGQKHNIDFITDIPEDSILSTSFFFKTDSLINFQEIRLENKKGLYRYTYDPLFFPGNSIEYYLVVQDKNKLLYAAPLNSKGQLSPMIRNLLDPKDYFKTKQ
tara:strand:- start:4035 stop:4541 length:507 start_codon:yes stop_codon:yes gene_type:complete